MVNAASTTVEGRTAVSNATNAWRVNIAGTAAAPQTIQTVQNRPHREALRHQLIVASFAVDLALLCLAMFLAYWIRFETPIRSFGVVGESVDIGLYAGHIAAGVITLLIVLANFRLYDAKNLLSHRQTARIIGKSCIAWFAGYLAVSLILAFDPPISYLSVLLSFAIALSFLLTWRWVLHQVLRREASAGLLRRRVVFIGWNDDCAAAIKQYIRGRGDSIAIEGVIAPPNGAFEAEPPSTVRVHRDFDAVRRVLKYSDVDTVLVADLDLGRSELVELSNFCEKEMIEFRLVPTCFRILLSGLHLETVSGIPVLGISKLPLDSLFNNHLKRVIDIVGGLVGLVVSVPLIAMFGTLIYLESPGPIFYKQRRVGRNGRLFEIIKLRSMRMDAESDGKAGWTVKGDPRVLRIGRFMRTWNIDEIPQFWNVLRGEMSLVGPRPERPEFIETFKEEIPHYNARHNIKPGITGWAQVNGFYGDTDIGERVRFDLDYIERWNAFLDFQILLMTFARSGNAH